MSHTGQFDLVDAGEGRWDVQEHGTLMVAGQVARTRTGFVLWDWLDRQLGTYDTIEDALHALIGFGDSSTGATVL